MAHTRSDTVPAEVISKLLDDAIQDPGLPRDGPTEAFWQIPASGISTEQSSELASKTRYAVIGSGITACSVAQNLLQLTHSDPSASVTVLEARTLCSGATGRNGGHLLSPMPEDFTRVERYCGRKETVKIARFADRTLREMYRLAGEGDPDLSRAAEVRHVSSACGYWDPELFKDAQKSHRRYEECVPEKRGDHEVFGPEEAREKFDMKDAVGVITSSAGAFWPYRLITGLFERLLERYGDRFAIETQTPVTSIEHDPASDEQYPYLLSTPRGTIRAAKVIHCTNGWSGHLLPSLRGKIFPLRGTMSVQAPGSNFPNQGKDRSWSTISTPTYDGTDRTFSYGLYYMTQNAPTGDLFLGGDKQLATELLSSDDTTVSAIAKETLAKVLPTIFANERWPKGHTPTVKSLWSGIMGFTPDHVPWVGQIPEAHTGRGGDGEWIAAGFNGYGMPLCWGCGEAVAKMILGGREVEAWLPARFLITRKRLTSPYSTVEAAIVGLLEPSLSWTATAKLVWRGVGSTVWRKLGWRGWHDA